MKEKDEYSEQVLSAAEALKMIRRPGAYKEEILYAKEHVSGSSADEVIKEAQEKLSRNPPAYQESLKGRQGLSGA